MPTVRFTTASGVISSLRWSRSATCRPSTKAAMCSRSRPPVVEHVATRAHVTREVVFKHLPDGRALGVARRALDVPLWAQHHNGIFKSTDSRESFTEIGGVQPSGFGFPVAVHPGDSRTAWFVPAVKDEKRYPVDGRVVINRTRDGGETFELLTRGLPQTHAYDLVYRHALDIDDTGACLAFGSSTGSVWLSEDGGDAWSTLATNLPPVYALRFEKD